MIRLLLSSAIARALLGALLLSLTALPECACATEANPVLKTTFNNGGNATDWIDFEFYRNGLIFFPVKINGHAAPAWLLVGATSEIDAGFASSLGLKAEHAFPSDRSAGPDTVAGVELEIGALTVQGISVRAKDLTTRAAKLGHPYSIQLGDDVFRNVVLDIDFPNHRLALRDPAFMIKPTGAQSLSLAKVGVGYSVPVSVEKAKPVLFHLEFGNSSPLMVTLPYAQSQKWLTGRRLSQRYTGPTKEPEGMVTLSHIAFAGTNFPRMPIVVIPESLFDPAWFDSDHLSGIVGMPLLARYRLQFDFSHDRLYAIANAKTVSEPFDKDRLGATLVSGQVAFISPNSPAQISGIKVGDKIALINGKPPEEMSNAETLALRYAPAKTTATFTLSDGEVHQITLAEYY